MCRASYGDEAVHLIRDGGSARLFHCTCPSCGRSMLALMTDHQGWVSTVGLVTDLEIADAIRLEDRNPLASDECIRLYQAIHQESKELCNWLLTEPKNS